MKFARVLICALMMSVLVVSASFAGDKEGKDGANTPDYKAVPKAMHEEKFPDGHPAVDRWLNHCYYDEKESIYFCMDDAWR